MKKTFIIIISLLLNYYSVSAQTWTCDKISSDIDFFNSLKKFSNNKWAENLKPYFPLNDDNIIELNYILYCTDSLPRTDLVAMTEGWLGTVFANPREQIQESNEYRIICVGDLGQVAYDQKFIGATIVKAPIEIIVLYKDNRVRLSLLTRNYRMGYANIGQVESGTIDIGSTFPFNKSSKHKGAYSMAYINTISKLLLLADGYLMYLNRHSADSNKSVPDW